MGDRGHAVAQRLGDPKDTEPTVLAVGRAILN